ncbi:MAG: FtsH protease activity modulator HflK [Gammaproteobacteria bacterium]
MAWNEPGGPQDNDPWGGRRKKPGPPDLDEIIRKIQQKLGALFGGKGGGAGGAPKGNLPSILALIAIAVVIWVAVDSVYIIKPAERGVVLRFGKYVDTLMPGPSIRLPRPIEQVIRVNVDQIRTVEVGYRSEGRQQMAIANEAAMLTQDENIVDVKLAVQYKVKSPADYLFHDRDPSITMRDATESAIREVVGKSKMDFVLKEGRSEVAARTKHLLQTILDRYNNGLLVTSVNLQDAQPPEPVQEAFFDAIRAREDQDRLINEAEAYANEVIPKARGGAARITEDANAYKAKIVATAKGDVSRFSQILTAYEKAPKVTRKRMYLETMQSVFGESSKVLVDVPKGSNLLYLPLDKLTQQAASSASKKQSNSSSDGSKQASSTQSSSDTSQTSTRQRTSSSTRTVRPTRETR